MSELEGQIAEAMGEEEVSTGDDGDLTTVEDSAGDGGAGVVADAPPPRSQKEIDQLTRRLEAEAERHAKRVAEIMGDDFALLVPSPVDWTPGFIFNVPQMHPGPDQVAELHALLGGAAPVELLDAEDAEGCPKCNALGEVRTGSRKPGQETKPCTACTGTGWRTRLTPPQPQPQLANGANVYAQPNPEPNQFQVADRWGRPFGHPHYNIEPAAVGV